MFICPLWIFCVHLLKICKSRNILINNDQSVYMKKCLFLVSIILCSMQILASNLVIDRHSGAEMLQDIAVIGKWVFVGEDLQLLDKAGNLLASESIANIRKITFSDEPTAIDDISSASSIIVYPNPAQDVLIVNGIEAQPLRVYDMQGKMVCSVNGTQVNVSGLGNGTYLLQVGTQVVRFIKK